MNGKEIAQIASMELGRTLKYVPDDQDCKTTLMKAGFDEYIADSYVEFFVKIANGQFQHLTNVNTTQTPIKDYFHSLIKVEWPMVKKEKGLGFEFAHDFRKKSDHHVETMESDLESLLICFISSQEHLMNQLTKYKNQQLRLRYRLLELISK